MRFALLALCFSLRVQACSCAATPSVSEAWANADAVVLAEVVRTEGVERLRPQTAWLSVKESFKGPQAGAEMVFRTPGDLCSPRFKPGSRAVFYAHRDGEMWEVYRCGRSTGFTAEDLLYLRRLPQAAAGGRLSGTVVLDDPDPTRPRRTTPLAGIAVSIAGDGATRGAVTNDDGVYEVEGLPPGLYTVTPKLPPGLKLAVALRSGRGSDAEQGTSVVLGERSTAGMGFLLREDRRLTGRVLGPDGRALRDACVTLETWEGQAYPFATHRTDSAGAYTLSDVPRGRYRLVVNRENRPTGAMPFPATYYPGVTDRAAARVITVDAEPLQAGLDVRIQQLQPRTVFAGQLQFRDGVPIAGATIELTQNGVGLAQTSSSPTGSFAIASLTGSGKAELRATVLAGPDALAACPHWQSYAYADAMTSNGVLLSLDAPQEGIYLTVNVSSCRGRQPGR